MGAYTIRLFGGFAVEQPPGATAPAAPQRRAEAVLAILAVCGSLGCSRERLMALLWPESDEAHGRHQLRDALYAIRRAYGSTAVHTEGETVRLDPATLRADVQEFAAALAEGRPADAVAVYGGAFLEGFHAAGSAEFERWIDGERARLSREYQFALKGLAQRAESAERWDAAAEWWDRLLAADPYNSRAVVRRMVALARSGDRANAIKDGEAHCRRLKLDLELDPDPELVEELERIRGGALEPSYFSSPLQARTAGVAEEETGKARPEQPEQLEAPAPRGTAAAEAIEPGPNMPAWIPAAPSLPQRNRPLSSRPALRSLIPWTLAWLAGAWLLFEITGALARSFGWGDAGAAAVTAALVVGWTALLLRFWALAKRAAVRVSATRLLTLAGILVLVAAGAALLGGRSRGPGGIGPEAGPVPAPWFRRAVQVTTSQAEDNAPRWSPDGRALVFQSDRTGNQDIWVTQPGSWQAVNRTPDSPADDVAPTWSPDGQWIAFFSGREDGGYFVMPSVGGTALKVASWARGQSSPTPAVWSPNSAQLAYGVNQGSRGPSLEILTLATGVSRRVPLPARPRGPVLVDMSWSPDGRWLAYRRAISAVAATAELWLTSIPGGESVQLTGESSWNGSPTWSPDARRLYFVSDRGGTSDVWSLAIGPDGHPLGAPLQMTSGQQVDGPQLSPDGARLAYTKRRFVRNVYRAPILSARPATWTDVTQLTFEEADYESVDVSRDGRLIFSTNRTGNWDLFITSSEGGTLEPFVTHPALDAGPRWTNDGSAVVFYSNRSGHREVWIQPVGGGPARQVTRGEVESFYPAISPDDREVAVQTTGRGIPVVTLASGTARRLTDDLDGSPDWSPDGRWVAFHSRRDGNYRIWVVPATGGSPRKVTASYGLSPRWSPDGKLLYYLHGDNGPGNRWDLQEIWAVSPESGRERPVTVLRGKRGFLANPGLATDGRFVYFTWQEVRSDIWVAELATRP